tara:strand:+ start:255 stop:446 length:192 start_codon:yes stop_codon:yes gene_type:complete
MFKMNGFSGFISPLKQDEKCYLDDEGKTVCPQSDKLKVSKESKPKKKEKVYQGGELPEVTIKG